VRHLGRANFVVIFAALPRVPKARVSPLLESGLRAADPQHRRTGKSRPTFPPGGRLARHRQLFQEGIRGGRCRWPADGELIEWARFLAYIIGIVDQELLLRDEYLAAENRILRGLLKGCLTLSNGERATLGGIGPPLGRQALAGVATAALPDTISG
jgi:hypothetical protein